MQISSFIAVWYCLASTAAFFAYAVDKAAARKDRRRVPERTLHAFSLAGGWPGAIIAQSLLRHKTRKQPFQPMFWLTVVLNCGVLATLMSSLP